MSNIDIYLRKASAAHRLLCLTRWNPMATGVLVALLSVALVAWMRPWGIVGGLRNWGEWLVYSSGSSAVVPDGSLTYSGAVILLGFLAGSFVSACLGHEFAIRVPPLFEAVKGIAAGCLMGIGAALAGGCNVGAMYSALGNLSAHGFAMWFGIVVGVLLGLKWLYWEMDHITWGSEGAATIGVHSWLRTLLGVGALAALAWVAIRYAGSANPYVSKLSVVLLLTVALGYAFQRGHWCMIQGFREPHMTGDATIAKSMAVSIFVYALGVAVLKANGFAFESFFVRGTFGWGAALGGAMLGFGAMLAGGCGSGTIWRAGEGQVKLWIVIPFFALANTFTTNWFSAHDAEGMTAWRESGVTDGGVLGRFVYLPDYLGYWGAVLLVGAAMVAWYLVVAWNQRSNKLIIEP